VKLSQYEAVIFDMDGVLIDSEPLWKIAMDEVFQSIGSRLTKQDFQKTVGLRIDEVVRFWHAYEAWQGVSPEEVEDKILQRMTTLIRQHPFPLKGVVDTLSFLKSKQIKVGLATSSYEILVTAVLDALRLREYFHFTHSAENEEYGKPHPAVFLEVAKQLGVAATSCLVIEDSLNGIIAAKSARMHVVCIPEKTHHPEPKLSLADWQFNDMSELLSLWKQQESAAISTSF
jgi:HAD superfamily hydrolase (TIGR01509 family)